MQAREVEKGVIFPDAFEPGGLDELLEAIASDFCANNYSGTSVDDIRVYGEMVLRPEITDETRQKLIVSIVQFPLFASSGRPGIISFKHELLAEYLFGRQAARTIRIDPLRGITRLATRPRAWDTLAFRYVVKMVMNDNSLRERILEELRSRSPQEKVFKALLQLWISSASRPVHLSVPEFLEGRDLSGVVFKRMDLSGSSFRNANLTDTVFSECRLSEVRFEGALLVGTRFVDLEENSMRGAQFGNIEHFEYIHSNSRLIEDRAEMKIWINEKTGTIEPRTDPCSTTLQFRGVLRKFIHDDGSGRRDQLPLHALSRGRIYPNAASAEDCINACIKHGFLIEPNFRGYVRRAAGQQYDEMVAFMRHWSLSTRLKTVLDELCPIKRCQHVP